MKVNDMTGAKESTTGEASEAREGAKFKKQ
jgi:hypothetical protein